MGKKRHTQKAEIRVDEATKKICQIVVGKGAEHDFSIHKKRRIPLPELKVLADRGYQGICKLHKNSETPHKKSLRKPLSKEQKRYNAALNSRRVLVEHVIRKLKTFKILSLRYRSRRKRFGLRINLIAALYNYEQNVLHG